MLILHGANGGEIHLSPHLVTSLQAAAPGQPNKLIVSGTNCMVNLVDGKFVAVVETCTDVARKIDASSKGSKP